MTITESIELDQKNRSLFRMVNEHSDVAKAQELELSVRELHRRQRELEMEDYARQRRADVCQAAAVVLFFGSGLCAAFGAWCFWCGAGPLVALGALGSAAVAAAVGFWCDGWSRE